MGACVPACMGGCVHVCVDGRVCACAAQVTQQVSAVTSGHEQVDEKNKGEESVEGVEFQILPIVVLELYRWHHLWPCDCHAVIV